MSMFKASGRMWRKRWDEAARWGGIAAQAISPGNILACVFNLLLDILFLPWYAWVIFWKKFCSVVFQNDYVSTAKIRTVTLCFAIPIAIVSAFVGLIVWAETDNEPTKTPAEVSALTPSERVHYLYKIRITSPSKLPPPEYVAVYVEAFRDVGTTCFDTELAEGLKDKSALTYDRVNNMAWRCRERMGTNRDEIRADELKSEYSKLLKKAE